MLWRALCVHMIFVEEICGFIHERHAEQYTWKYCWWTKSCTTKDDDYPIIYRVLYIPGGAGFLPSTVARFFGDFWFRSPTHPPRLFSHLQIVATSWRHTSVRKSEVATGSPHFEKQSYGPNDEDKNIETSNPNFGYVFLGGNDMNIFIVKSRVSNLFKWKQNHRCQGEMIKKITDLYYLIYMYIYL